MKYVEFYETAAEGQETIGRVIFIEKDGISFEGLSENMIESLKEGVILKGKEGMKKIFPKDGARFLEALPYVFTGSYLRASKPLSVSSDG